MSRFLVTGVSGFVGRYFWELLKLQGGNLHVLGIDRAVSVPWKDARFEYRSMDLLTERDELLHCVSDFQPDYILHLAAVSSVSQSWKDPAACFASNTGIYTNLLEAVRHGCPRSRVLLVGSSEVYGNWPAETMPLNENMSLAPNNPYGVSRVAQEMLTKLYIDSYGLQLIMTRSFNHIGPGQKKLFVIPSFIAQLVNLASTDGQGTLLTGDISVIRDFLDVRDVVDAYWRILKRGQIGAVYNVCSGQGRKLSDIIDAAARELGIAPEIKTDPVRIRPSDTPCIIGDNTLLRQQLGWIPQYTLPQTLKDIITAMKKEREREFS